MVTSYYSTFYDHTWFLWTTLKSCFSSELAQTRALVNNTMWPLQKFIYTTGITHASAMYYGVIWYRINSRKQVLKKRYGRKAAAILIYSAILWTKINIWYFIFALNSHFPLAWTIQRQRKTLGNVTIHVSWYTNSDFNSKFGRKYFHIIVQNFV